MELTFSELQLQPETNRGRMTLELSLDGPRSQWAIASIRYVAPNGRKMKARVLGKPKLSNGKETVVRVTFYGRLPVARSGKTHLQVLLRDSSGTNASFDVHPLVVDASPDSDMRGDERLPLSAPAARFSLQVPPALDKLRDGLRGLEGTPLGNVGSILCNPSSWTRQGMLSRDALDRLLPLVKHIALPQADPYAELYREALVRLLSYPHTQRVVLDNAIPDVSWEPFGDGLVLLKPPAGSDNFKRLLHKKSIDVDGRVLLVAKSRYFYCVVHSITPGGIVVDPLNVPLRGRGTRATILQSLDRRTLETVLISTTNAMASSGVQDALFPKPFDGPATGDAVGLAAFRAVVDGPAGETRRFSAAALNDEQKSAVGQILLRPPLVVVQGPPGTGKTTTLVHAAAQIAMSGARVLIIAQSNSAADTVFLKLHPLLEEARGHAKPAIRVYCQSMTKTKVKRSVQNDTEAANLLWGNTVFKTVRRRGRDVRVPTFPAKGDMERAGVVVMTVAMASRLADSEGGGARFDYLFVDEASQIGRLDVVAPLLTLTPDVPAATLPHHVPGLVERAQDAGVFGPDGVPAGRPLVPGSGSKWRFVSPTLVVFGDRHQLGPVAFGSIAGICGDRISLMESLTGVVEPPAREMLEAMSDRASGALGAVEDDEDADVDAPAASAAASSSSSTPASRRQENLVASTLRDEIRNVPGLRTPPPEWVRAMQRLLERTTSPEGEEAWTSSHGLKMGDPRVVDLVQSHRANATLTQAWSVLTYEGRVIASRGERSDLPGHERGRRALAAFLRVCEKQGVPSTRRLSLAQRVEVCARNALEPPITEEKPRGILVVCVDAPVKFVRGSARNEEEIKWINSFVEALSNTDKETSIVVAPYRAQCEALQAALPGVPCGPVEVFQGQEASIVFITTSRGMRTTGSSGALAEDGIGFLSNPRRMNVAVTRARDCLVVVASSTVIKASPLLKGLAAAAVMMGCFVDTSGKFLPPSA
jgi:DNA polymerase III delta prime subunit